MIREFQGEYRFLSNFWITPIYHDGIMYPSVEHAFQAAKTLDWEKRKLISQFESPLMAKRAGRKLVLRENWDHIRFYVMHELVLHKFASRSVMKAKLLSTGNKQLIEGNYWGDTYWGVSPVPSANATGKGQNNLGRILMGVRDLLR